MESKRSRNQQKTNPNQPNNTPKTGQLLDPKSVAKASLDLAIEMLNLSMGLVVIVQDDTLPIILASHNLSTEWQKMFVALSREHSDDYLRRAIKTERPVVFRDASAQVPSAQIQLFQQSNWGGMVFFPFVVPGDLAGVLVVGDTHPREFQPDDMTMLIVLTQQISSGLQNAWVLAKTQRQLNEAKAVADAANVVVSSLDLDQILNYIMVEVTTRLQTEAAALLLLDSVQNELEFAAAAGPASDTLVGVRLPMGQGIVGWVAERNEALLVPDVAKDERFFQGLDTETETVSQSILCVPLRSREQLIGVVEVINKKQGQFSLADQRLLEALATFAAVAIENARLFDEANRQIEQATLYARDLSEAYKRERKERAALDRLRFNFLNVVGHELKTPLTVMLQGLEALQNPNRGALNAEQREILDMIGDQSEQLGQLIDGLVAFATFSARQGTMKFKPVSFAEVLEDVIALSYFKTARQNINLKDERQTELPTLLLDKERMSEAISHLVDNAVKYSNLGSEVIIRSDVVDGQLKIDIIDCGQGIPADQIDNIWDSFTQMNTTMERGLEGLGLGLAIARYIIEAHSGTISVSSELGVGTTFTIQLPVKPLR